VRLDRWLIYRGHEQRIDRVPRRRGQALQSAAILDALGKAFA
jgi:hypothetical protein